MTPVFVFGTLRHGPIRQMVAGGAVAVSGAARLPGERVARAAAGDWPVLAPAAGEAAEGLLLKPDAAALARLDFYEAIFGYFRVPVRVETPQGPVAAEVWRPPGAPEAAAEDWDLDAWVRAHGALALAAGEEMMRAHGRVPPAQVAARVGIIRSRAQAALRTADWARPGRLSPGTGGGAVETLARDFPYEGFHAVEWRRLRHRRFDGTLSAPIERAVFRATDAVTVLPYDPLRDRVLLVEQLRLGPLMQGDPAPFLLEPVAGMIDAGESPEETAHRETREEAGLALRDLHFVARYYPTPGGVAQVLHSYIGIADLLERGTWTGGHVAEDEDIRAHAVDWPEALALKAAGDMVNAALLISMHWLEGARPDLRRAAGCD